MSLNSVDSICVSQELKETIDENVKHVSFSAHFIKKWRYHHVMLASQQMSASEVSDQEHWETVKNTVLTESTSARVIEVINNLTDQRCLPGFHMSDSKPSISTLIPTGQVSYSCLLDEAVISAVEKCGDELKEIIGIASKLVVTSEQIDWDCDTTNAKDFPWYKQLHLVSKTVNMTETMKALFESLGFSDRFLSEEQRRKLTVVVEVLKPFQEVAERIRIDGSVSCSLAFASIKLLKTAINDYMKIYPDHDLLTHLKEEFHRVTHPIDNGEANSYTIATILDPRFKLQWCEPSEQEKFKMGLIESAKEAVKREEPEGEQTRPVFPQTGGGFFTRILQQQPETDIVTSNITSEVFRYMEESLKPENCDILEYWRSNQYNYPNLSTMAQRYLSIPTSLSDIRGYYDTDNQIFSIQNTNITGDILNRVIELRSLL